MHKNKIKQNPLQAFEQARALHRDGKLSQSAAIYKQLLRDYPTHYQLLTASGLLALQQGRYEDAARQMKLSLEIHPDQAATLTNLAIAYRWLGKREEALECYDRAISMNPRSAEAHNNRGNVLNDLNRIEEAMMSFAKAVTLQPDYAKAQYSLAEALKQLKRYDAALEAFQRARPLNADANYITGSYLDLKLLLCNWEDFDKEADDLLAEVEQGNYLVEPLLIIRFSDSPYLQKKCAETIIKQRHPQITSPGIFKKPKRKDKIHIAYFSADFRGHPVGMLTAELFEKHDRERFDLSAFSFGPKSDDTVRQRIAAAFGDGFIDVTDLKDQEIARLAREMGIDIAIDLGGFTGHARAGAFAERVAPIQVSYLGYPGTMGASFMDYIIADQVAIPPDSRCHYAEKVVYLPGSYMIRDTTKAIAERRMTREEYGLPSEGFVFCCFNNCYKILPDIFERWMNMMRRIEGSVLWLMEDHRTATENLRREAARRGVDEDRLIFANRVEHFSEHLARQRLADLFVDTRPYNAHTTSNDALWAGLPVLTCAGECFASRVSASFLNTLELPELITTSLDEYEETAVRLATHPEQLAAIRAKLATNRTTTSLFNTVQFARGMEAAWTAMYERHLAGLPPDHIVIPAS